MNFTKTPWMRLTRNPKDVLYYVNSGILAAGILAQWVFMTRLHLYYKASPCNTTKDNNKEHSTSTKWMTSNSDTQAIPSKRYQGEVANGSSLIKKVIDTMIAFFII